MADQQENGAIQPESVMHEPHPQQQQQRYDRKRGRAASSESINPLPKKTIIRSSPSLIQEDLTLGTLYNKLHKDSLDTQSMIREFDIKTTIRCNKLRSALAIERDFTVTCLENVKSELDRKETIITNQNHQLMYTHQLIRNVQYQRLQDRQDARALNYIFHHIPEERGEDEDPYISERVLRHHCYEMYDVEHDMMDTIYFSDVSRVGVFKQNKIRPMLVKFLRKADKYYIWKAARDLNLHREISNDMIEEFRWAATVLTGWRKHYEEQGFLTKIGNPAKLLVRRTANVPWKLVWDCFPGYAERQFVYNHMPERENLVGVDARFVHEQLFPQAKLRQRDERRAKFEKPQYGHIWRDVELSSVPNPTEILPPQETQQKYVMDWDDEATATAQLNYGQRKSSVATHDPLSNLDTDSREDKVLYDYVMTLRDEGVDISPSDTLAMTGRINQIGHQYSRGPVPDDQSSILTRSGLTPPSMGETTIGGIPLPQMVQRQVHNMSDTQLDLTSASPGSQTSPSLLSGLIHPITPRQLLQPTFLQYHSTPRVASVEEDSSSQDESSNTLMETQIETQSDGSLAEGSQRFTRRTSGMVGVDIQFNTPERRQRRTAHRRRQEDGQSEAYDAINQEPSQSELDDLLEGRGLTPDVIVRYRQKPETIPQWVKETPALLAQVVGLDNSPLTDTTGDSSGDSDSNGTPSSQSFPPASEDQRSTVRQNR